ncbi:MAG: hypothetical protein FWF38_04860 [Spirochaetaceae bacterium]|nr:hypothetical protein [Spirochaetaceae bacterium]
MSLLHFLAGAAAAKILTSNNPDTTEKSHYEDPYGRKFFVDIPDDSFSARRPKTYIFLFCAAIFVPSAIIAIFIIKLFYS